MDKLLRRRIRYPVGRDRGVMTIAYDRQEFVQDLDRQHPGLASVMADLH